MILSKNISMTDAAPWIVGRTTQGKNDLGKKIEGAQEVLLYEPPTKALYKKGKMLV